MSIHKELNRIQKELKAPKNQYNSFGKYKYRNAEDILEAYKQIAGETTLVTSDEPVLVGNRVYIKCTATLELGEETKIATGFAREPEQQKGMNDSQITGSASSYAKKYAIGNLFAIDDTKDADATNKGAEEKTAINPDLLLVIQEATTEDELRKIWEAHKTVKGLGAIITKRKNEIA
jgi:hypothetical protein